MPILTTIVFELVRRLPTGATGRFERESWPVCCLFIYVLAPYHWHSYRHVLGFSDPMWYFKIYMPENSVLYKSVALFVSVCCWYIEISIGGFDTTIFTFSNEHNSLCKHTNSDDLSVVHSLLMGYYGLNSNQSLNNIFVLWNGILSAKGGSFVSESECY